MRQRVTSKHSQRGQGVLALIWVLVWLAGMAAITYWCISRTIPALEQKIQRNAEASIAPASNAQVSVNVSGRTATLSGKLSEESQRQPLITAAMGAEGVTSVIDKLIVPAPMQTSATGENDVLIANNATQTVATPKIVTPIVDAPKPEANADIGAQALASLKPRKPTIPTVDTKDDVVANSVQSAQASVASLSPPKLRILSQEDTLTFTGTVSNEDNLLQLIQLSMSTFNADYVVNSVQTDTQTAKAHWLPDLIDFLPQLNSLTDAGVEIVSTQITLSGKAASEAAHDEVINKALSALDTFSLVERISIEQNNNAAFAATDAITLPANAATVLDATTRPTVAAETQSTASVEPVTTSVAPTVDNTTLTSVAITDSTEDEVAKILADAREEIRSNAVLAAETTTSAELNATASVEPVSENTNIETSAIAISDNSQTNENNPEPVDNASLEAQRQSLTAEFEALENGRILFESGSDVLTAQSTAVLETMAALFMEYPNVPIEIDGHTDASGNAAANIALSQTRANAVRDTLVELGVSIYRISAYGFGDGVPIADNGTDAGRRLNRRIEFLF